MRSLQIHLMQNLYLKGLSHANARLVELREMIEQCGWRECYQMSLFIKHWFGIYFVKMSLCVDETMIT